MKYISIISQIVTLAVFSILIVSCNQKKIEPQQITEGEVSFQFNVSSKGKSKISNRRSGEIATAVVVTIVDQLGDTVYNKEELPLYNFDGTYISKSISLVTGAYQLVEFLVLDQNSNVIYATPKEGTPLEYLVADPLAIDFNIIKDEVTQVIPEVISTAEFTPDDFGYTTFRFEVVPIFHFQIAIMAFNESTQNCELTTAELSVSGDGTALHTTSLGNITNVVTIQDGYSNYTLTIEKTGYQTIDTTFINSVLKTHENDPIEVHLIETGTTSGTFTDSGQNLGNSTSSKVSLGDLDGDGDLDAFVANTSHDKIWINDGNGNFTDSGHAFNSIDSREIGLGDLDGDGDLDAFIAHYFGNPNSVHFNDGNGNFTNSGQNLGNFYSEGVALGDLDNDGDLDAFVVNENLGQPNKVWLNDGAGTFTDNGQALGLATSTAVSLGDIDNDGDIDAYVTNHSTANILWINDGNGNFSDSGQNLGNLNSIEVDIGDLDNDSDLDVFVVNFTNQPNKIWLNDGIGSLSENGQMIGNSNSYDLDLGDVDNDNDLDVIIANHNQPNKIWLNDGNGNFTDSGQSLGSSQTIGVALGDLNGDGILDAFTVNFSAQPNKVWFGQS